MGYLMPQCPLSVVLCGAPLPPSSNVHHTTHPTGQLDRVVVPPCLNLAPNGTPSNKPIAIPTPAPAASSKQPSKHTKTSSSKGSSSGSHSGKGPGSKGGIGMKSCESFVASPDASGGGLVAFLGDSGHIGLVSLGSRSAVGSFKMNGSARAAAFSSDGRTLVSAGEAGWLAGYPTGWVGAGWLAGRVGGWLADCLPG